MNNKFTALVLFLTLTISHLGAFACPGAHVEINNSTWIAGDGIYGSKGLEYSPEALQKMALDQGRAVLLLNDKSGISTHRLEFLGMMSDEGGVIQSIYLLQDLKTKQEKTLVIKSNYSGNGVTAKGIDSPDSKLKPYYEYGSVLQAGCQ